MEFLHCKIIPYFGVNVFVYFGKNVPPAKYAGKVLMVCQKNFAKVDSLCNLELQIPLLKFQQTRLLKRQSTKIPKHLEEPKDSV